MRAAVYRRFGPPHVVQVADVALPPVGPGEVLIEARASTVSSADRRARSRDVPPGLWIPSALTLGVLRPRRPVLGMDVAGVVAAVGSDVTRFAPGDEVVAMLGSRFGGHAEYVVVPESGAVTTKPSTMGFEDAVTLVFGGITARGYLGQVDVHPGTTVLVNGAAGAVGTAVVQLARYAGAHVTAVCSVRNIDMVTALGADRVIDYASADFLAEKAAYDVVVDCVGNASFPRSRHLLAPGGALLLVVSDLRGVLSAGWYTRRSGHPVITTPGPWRVEDLAHLVALAESGDYRPVHDRTFDLSDVAAAHRHVDAGKRANVILRISDGGPRRHDHAEPASAALRAASGSHPERLNR
ncbi:NAD(P)-dependent alcohol dehydrogenase [Georgenia subflava]|uniref:Zinc-binding dehydrogenase n=1 Tax=Georgenia subflava TaxID=1622177 RepID=A0A6N7EH18_9MICO|nr:NAD(P)-dependent alcohol dehydrogenase [Georgenia subflava]MPV37662.1 zinc-binding dehydrogenase [Georgenia subflava]